MGVGLRLRGVKTKVLSLYAGDQVFTCTGVMTLVCFYYQLLLLFNLYLMTR